jgi:hypothetical protein
MLQLLLGVEDIPQSAAHGEIEDIATELLAQITYLLPLSPRIELQKIFPPPDLATVQYAIQLLAGAASLRHQLSAVNSAQPHNLLQARRVLMLIANRLDQSAAAIDSNHDANRLLFASLAVGYSRLLFPVVLSLMKKPKWRAGFMSWVFQFSQQLRSPSTQVR